MTKMNRICGKDLAALGVQGDSTLIIAEAGINHNGEKSMAFRMIDCAKEAGADAVKFQTFHAADFISDAALTHSYFSQGKQVTESQMAMFERCEFSPEQWREIAEYCKKKDIIFLSTPQNTTDLDILLPLGIPAIKVGSDDFVNLPLLKSYARTGLPLLLSCGMADGADIHTALKTVGYFEGYPVVLFLCTSEYPTPPEDVNLKRLETLKTCYPGLVLGFSDHTQGATAAACAAILGARVFEKHFTLDHNLPGPDHWFSADPGELKIWCDTIRDAVKIGGSAILEPAKAEKENALVSHRVLVASKKIKRGELFTPQNMCLKRVSATGGYASQYYDFFCGIPAPKDFSSGDLITLLTDR